jgi:tetratricopeptide (TPR) repeat protein
VAGSAQMPHINQLYHMRGLCYFKLKLYDFAEKDFQEAILISDDKSKIIFYNSLGKCKMAIANKDPNAVTFILFSSKKQSNVFRRCWSLVIELMDKLFSTLGLYIEE